MRVLLPAVCAGCGHPGPVLCRACVRAFRCPPLTVPEAIVLGAFAGPLRTAVHGLKYRGATAVAREFARLLADRVPPDVTAVAAVPTTARRRRRRGYDQAELIARELARALRVSHRRLLVRADPRGAPQTGRGLADRMCAVPDEFRVRGPASGRLIIVDDVITTGATMRAALVTLRAAGSDAVPAAVAATPRWMARKT